MSSEVEKEKIAANEINKVFFHMKIWKKWNMEGDKSMIKAN